MPNRQVYIMQEKYTVSELAHSQAGKKFPLQTVIFPKVGRSSLPDAATGRFPAELKPSVL